MASSEAGFLEQRLREFLDAVPARTPAPASGSVTALVTALAAGLAAMSARFAPEEWGPRAGLVGLAEELRSRAEPLADADAAAYAAYLAKEDGAAERIVAIPLELAELAAQVAELAARVAREGNPAVAGDAAAAAILAEGAARVAARLVELNAPHGDRRVVRSAALARQAAGAAARAVAADA